MAIPPSFSKQMGDIETVEAKRGGMSRKVRGPVKLQARLEQTYPLYNIVLCRSVLFW